VDAFESSCVISINEGSTSVGLSKGNSLVSSTWEGVMSLVSRVLLIFDFEGFKNMMNCVK